MHAHLIQNTKLYYDILIPTPYPNWMIDQKGKAILSVWSTALMDPGYVVKEPSVYQSLFIGLCAGVHLPQRDHHGPRALHPVHHPRELRPALAGDRLQPVHLRVSLPAAPGHHDLLLRPHPGGDLQPHGPRHP